ncbi:uncharacterized protein LOC121870027 [Homarus americanus]|uniref:Proto-oncogene DBL-like n=1 Tax=Homarus americanus TaxID=6706 RepID=A0A8J5JWS8_HOMAM|nr:uncharacterized protein LOC121870027 [Homarus americanus]KAG7166037.1 Proto-oncogene DBL-like [Homarus americanus]
MTSVSGVLLGVAEVKLPLRRLPQELRSRIANVSHWAVVHGDYLDEDNKGLLEERQQYIGEVDNFYALREVEVKVEEPECRVIEGTEVVLKHRTSDVIIITPVEESPTRVVYISRSDSFGRAAVVLQMKSQQDVNQLLALFPAAVPDSLLHLQSSPGTQLSPNKELKQSWSRGVSKRFTAMLASLAGTASTTKKGPRTSDKINTPPEPSDSPTPNSESSSDSDSDDEEMLTDDTDSKSAGKYYEDMGLDANVQERLYDDAAETLSKSSDSSLESNSAIIEAEMRFFVESDEEFLKSLRSLEEDRERLADSETPQFIRENLTLLFMQVKALTQLHSELHAEFENSYGYLQRLSDAIVSHQNDYENYVYFMENIPIVDRILHTHKDYFKTHIPELPEKLRKPRMRLHYYVLTLETLHKKCNTREEKHCLQKAMDILKVPLKKADSKLFLGAVTGSPFDLTNFGNLIRHSDLTLRRGGDLPRRVYHVLVLKTLILLTTSDGRNYRYVTSFRMDQVGLGKQERGVLFNLEVRNGPRGQTVCYTFKAKNINMQQLWINDLKDILKEKPKTATPRNSFIEGQSDLRLSGKRSKMRRGHSAESSWSSSQGTVSDSDILDEENTRTGRSENNASWSGRRAAIKKNSSTSGKPRPAVRQQSGYTSDSESNSLKWRNQDSLTPLTVWAVFPQLKDLFKLKSLPCESENSVPTILVSLLDKEIEYTLTIHQELGSLLNDEISKPPSCIITQLRKIYDFHTTIFLSLLETAVRSGKKQEVVQCFIDCSVRLKELYSNYLADRARLDGLLRDMELYSRFVQPVLQFEIYMKFLASLLTNKSENQTVNAALSMLRECVADANTILLTETIKGAPFDLDDCGPVLMAGNAKVRWTGQLIKQEFHMVLLDTMILILESHPPSYRYVDSIRMDTVGIGPIPDEYSFQLEVRTAATKTLTYVFRTPNRNMQKQWLDEITILLSLQVDRLKEKQRRRLGNETPKMQTLKSPPDSELYSVSPRSKSPLETSL